MKKKLKPSFQSKKHINYVSIFLFTFALSTNVLADDRNGLLVNGSVSVLHDDNILNSSEKASDTAVTVAPDIKYLGLVGKHKFLFSYKGEFASYIDDSKLNYNDHNFTVGARLDHSYKINTEFKLGYDKKIEEPGSTNSSTTLLTEFNEYKNKSALARLYYGQKTSTGQIALEYKYDIRDYTNNFQDFRSFDLNQLSTTFFYRVAPKTRLLFQASAIDYKYEDQALANGISFNQSSEQKLYLAGVEWEATAKSTGIFKIGYQDKDFDDVRFNDISSLYYALDMIWRPNTYTRIKLGATRQTTESALLNEAGFLSTSYSIDVSHEIMTRTRLKAGYVFDNDDIVSGSNRSDKRNTIKLGAIHSLRKWLDVKLEYQYQDKSSNIDLFNFESNSIQLSLETVFE